VAKACHSGRETGESPETTGAQGRSSWRWAPAALESIGWSWRRGNRRGVEFKAQGRPVGEIAALRPETAELAQPGQAPLGLLLLQEGIDRLADQSALAAATAQGQGPAIPADPPQKDESEYAEP
jgi:hypothetical protein